MTEQPPYAVRLVETAHPPRHSYEVYNTETDAPVIRYAFRRGETFRVKAEARAKLHANTLNWRWLKEQK